MWYDKTVSVSRFYCKLSSLSLSGNYCAIVSTFIENSIVCTALRSRRSIVFDLSTKFRKLRMENVRTFFFHQTCEKWDLENFFNSWIIHKVNISFKNGATVEALKPRRHLYVQYWTFFRLISHLRHQLGSFISIAKVQRSNRIYAICIGNLSNIFEDRFFTT